MEKGIVEEVAEDGKSCVVRPITDNALSWTAVIPWWMRKETGASIVKGTDVVFETFVDGSAFVVSRFDGDGGTTLYGNPLKLGDASASDFVALASKVESDLEEIKNKFNQHTHAVAEAEAAAVTPEQQLWPAVIPGVGASKVKAV